MPVLDAAEACLDKTPCWCTSENYVPLWMACSTFRLGPEPLALFISRTRSTGGLIASAVIVLVFGHHFVPPAQLMGGFTVRVRRHSGQATVKAPPRHLP